MDRQLSLPKIPRLNKITMTDFKIPLAYIDLVDKKHIYPTSASHHIDYFCPGCYSIVRKRDSTLGNPHFYHINSDKKCSLESVRHKLYKRVILQHKKFLTPNNELLIFDKVEEEKNLLDFRPDIIGYIGKKMYIIEIVNTSAISDSKYNKIKKSNTDCFNILAVHENYLDIISHVLDETNYKKLIYNNQIQELEELKEYLKNAIAKYEIEIEELKESKENAIAEYKIEIEELKENLENEIAEYKNVKIPAIQDVNKLVSEKFKEIIESNFAMNFSCICSNGWHLYRNPYYDDFVIFFNPEKKRMTLKFNKYLL